ncbi:hypothetical protein NL343_28305, partial [Klebsiella pneumoniae]|nr:hypothetical protein [Klebsiella pneumoniae]
NTKMANETLGGMNRVFKGRSGTFTVAGTTPVVVADKRVTPNSVIIHSIKTVGGTVGPRTVTVLTPGTGFTVVGTASDTSVYNYML